METKESQKEMGAFQEVPSEVGMEILSRVPLATISECRWVCNTWYDLILSPRFAKLHYFRTIQDKSSAWIVSCFIDTLSRPTSSSSTVKELLNLMARFQIKVPEMASVGSANGLICFATSLDHFHPMPCCICNVVTADALVLPESPENNICPVAAGFGFDELTEKYTVIQILKQNLKFEAGVFSLGSVKWRKIRNVPTIVRGKSKPVSVRVNGNLHWINFEDGSEAIDTFNVGKEEFDVLQFPNCKKSMNLAVVKVCLSLITYTYGDSEIWVTEQYGIHASWAKQYVFTKEMVGPNWNMCHEIIHVKSSRLLLHVEKQCLGFYDPERGTFWPIKIENLDTDLNIRPPLMLVGSLFLPRRIVLKSSS